DGWRTTHRRGAMPVLVSADLDLDRDLAADVIGHAVRILVVPVERHETADVLDLQRPAHAHDLVVGRAEDPLVLAMMQRAARDEAYSLTFAVPLGDHRLDDVAPVLRVVVAG